MKSPGRVGTSGGSAGTANGNADGMDTIRVGSLHAEPVRNEDEDEGDSSAEEDVTDGMAAISDDIPKARRYFGRVLNRRPTGRRLAKFL